MLFFVAGSEIEFAAFRGRTGAGAIFGWLISLARRRRRRLADRAGREAVIIGIALCSTALGTILPILRDAGELHTPFGRAVERGRGGRRVRSAHRDLDLPRRPAARHLGDRARCCSPLVAGLAIWLAFKVPRGAMHRVRQLERCTRRGSSRSAWCC